MFVAMLGAAAAALAVKPRVRKPDDDAKDGVKAVTRTMWIGHV